MSKVVNKMQIEMPSAAEDRKITAAAKADDGSTPVVKGPSEVRKQEASGVRALQP